MSKSRLEKFLYALYSLDSSDLPTPLSRIDELYKCLVTGEEAPTFKPISRVEKYLMAILGGYDVDSLPNPLSRVEVLLYKLATGDDNLDDVEIFLSEHEELLAEIIRNGGAGGNIDIEYVLYTLSTGYNTLYNTAEKPVKSAILKGNTKYRDIDTGDILDTFDETKNLELVSVQMPVLMTAGKNLFDGKILNNSDISGTNGQVSPSGYRTISVNFIKVTPNTAYTITRPVALGNVGIRYYSLTQSFISSSAFIDHSGKFTGTFRTPSNCYFIKFIDESNTQETGYQIESGSVATPYEPYQSNILKVNEDVVLCGVGEVKDEFDLLTGKVTRRIGEVVFDGSEDWVQSTGLREPTIFYTSINDMAHKYNYQNSIICDKFVTYTSESSLMDSTLLNAITGYSDDTDSYPNENWLYIKLADSEGSVENLKQWLSQNPVTVRYELITESVETVDISVVDQDRNNTELSTFNDITHVTLSSEGLIPEAELEVATKNGEVLSTLSLEMDDISTSQNTLEETANTQSENVDATMIATTEIYEGLL